MGQTQNLARAIHVYKSPVSCSPHLLPWYVAQFDLQTNTVLNMASSKRRRTDGPMPGTAQLVPAAPKDIFSSLHPDAQLAVFLHLSSRRDVANLCQASRAMHQQWQESERLITREFVRHDLAGGLVQDAMAVVLFPYTPDYEYNEYESDTTNGDPTTTRRLRVDLHLRSWAAERLPNPLRTLRSNDYQAIKTLDTLCRWVRRYA